MGSQLIIITGNVGKDAEKRFLSTGTALLSFNVAVNEYYKGEENTTWFRVTVWGDKKVEYLESRITKGVPVYIEGSLRKGGPQVYESQGEHRASYEVNAYKVTTLVGSPGTKNKDYVEDNKTPEIPF